MNRADFFNEILPTGFKLDKTIVAAGPDSLKVYDNKLYYWQEDSFGIASVNERSLVQDNNIGQLVLGTGDILARYDYISTNFGNSIVKQMKDFVATFVECGGREVDAVDYYIARKILRKFEQLNLAYIRDEIDGFIEFLDKNFGKENFNECKEYLLRLKKMV